MALVTSIAGAYTGVYVPRGRSFALNEFAPLGITRDGFLLSWTVHQHLVNKTTSFGRSIIEMIYLGADWRMAFVAVEYSIASTAFLDGSVRRAVPELLWMWNEDGQVQTPALVAEMSTAGNRAWDTAGTIILTSATGTSARTVAAPNTFTAERAITAPNSQLRQHYTSKERESPIDLQLLPYQDNTTSSGNVWFTTT